MNLKVYISDIPHGEPFAWDDYKTLYFDNVEKSWYFVNTEGSRRWVTDENTAENFITRKDTNKNRKIIII